MVAEPPMSLIDLDVAAGEVLVLVNTARIASREIELVIPLSART
jgi:hypothetical protein